VEEEYWGRDNTGLCRCRRNWARMSIRTWNEAGADGKERVDIDRGSVQVLDNTQHRVLPCSRPTLRSVDAGAGVGVGRRKGGEKGGGTGP
jgi:hypothetical protein